MSLRLHDTRRGVTEAFVPRVSGRVGMYVCGATVQGAPHVGHLRSAVAFDLIRRWLLASGYAVTFVRNITDIDDKIIHAAAHRDEPWWAVAERSAREFGAAYDALGCLPTNAQPRATGHIPQMLALVGELVDRGHAYAAGGDVYLAVRTAPGYGELSNQRIDDLLPAETSRDAKRDPLDFALWKAARPGEPAWSSPWGPGRPGWHLECSAMAVDYLGTEFDLHGGGLDLVFPHHENELAQSRCAGHRFARGWLHNGLVVTDGEKMSKSLGNSALIADLLAAHSPQSLRYALLAPHYRSTLDWSAAVAVEAEATYRRVAAFVGNATRRLGGVGDAEAAGVDTGEEAPKRAWGEFSEAMDDDLAVPRALAVLHAAVRAGNAAVETGDRQLAGWLAVVRRMLDVLGLDPISQWGAAAGGRLEPVVDALVELALTERRNARARGDYAAADAVRDRLQAVGVVVEDTAGGARWRLAVR